MAKLTRAIQINSNKYMPQIDRTIFAECVTTKDIPNESKEQTFCMKKEEIILQKNKNENFKTVNIIVKLTQD